MEERSLRKGLIEVICQREIAMGKACEMTAFVT